ncbi:MAG: putative peptide maturation dehydrogenase, partial [Holophagales bacterium]|nr:putative peptide maturation dehydrogenase [Holophagales bacterium]
RSTAFTLRFESRASVDVEILLRGRLSVGPRTVLLATSLLTGETDPLSEPELRALFATGEDWQPVETVLRNSGAGEEEIQRLLAKGLLLADDDDPRHTELREKEAHMIGVQWDGFALQYHLGSRQKGVNAAALARAPAPASLPADVSPSGGAPAFTLPDDLPTPVPFSGAASVLDGSTGGPPSTEGEALAEKPASAALPPGDGAHRALLDGLAQQLHSNASRFGPPPPHFHRRQEARASHELPVPEVRDSLLHLLARRRTTRLFDAERPMSAAQLSTILFYTYGCHGYAPLAPEVIGLKKTSPSGGALHPVEAYPLLLHVDGLEPGLYHYRTEHHALDLLRPLGGDEARRLAEHFVGGQSYYRTAHALFVLTARFHRNFWKYRRSPKAYRVVLLDAGHLSQTLYLLATHLGLGAFFTAAVNDIDIEEALGIDGVEEGVIGVSGCGPPLPEDRDLGLTPRPYRPRSTRL